MFTRIGGCEAGSAARTGRPVSPGEEIDVLRSLAPEYRVWGGYDGRGLVIRSPEPVDFHPDGKIVDVVPVAELTEAVGHAGVATLTVGVYPPTESRGRAARRPRLCRRPARGVPRRGGGNAPPGLSPDGFYPLQRLVRRVNDE
ncbi:hypothetical protein [Streptomyces sp. NPDC058295]|uniref:hypothetical protein n=1 Tax=Streptomyces sp. NPDC058295 TaxID=3346431 RepID=UPI0036E059BE